MHKNYIWAGLLTLIVIAAFWFVGKASKELLYYYRFSTPVEGVVEKIEVVQQSEDRYVLQVFYNYTFKNKEIRAIGYIGPRYLNPWAADQGLKKYQHMKELKVWLNSKKPSSAILERVFPLKQVISSAVILALIAYFVILGIYVGGKNGRKI